MDSSGIQLEMNFDGAMGNRFKEKLDNGNFQVLVEVNAPPSETKLADAVTRFSEIEYLVSAKQELNAALTFTDRYAYPEALDNIQFAAALCKTDRDRHLICVSGRDRTVSDLEKILGHAANEGFKNIIAVSGESIKGDSLKQVQSRLFTESVHTLRSIREKFNKNLFAGCAVNPYKYTPCTCFPQHFKLFKKISLGASFMVTQFGWDMLKLQELRWSLFRRSLHIPSIARFLVLTPDKAEEICSGKLPGVHISPDFQAMLRRETMHSMAQFEAAQWRRIQIHAAGARFLGYSGIQIAGLERPDQINIMLNRIREALNEFAGFEEWRTAYQEYYARLDMAPYPYRFYEFEELFSKAHPSEMPRMANAEIPPLEDGEKFKLNLAHKLFANADRLPASERYLTKKLLVSCRGCPECRLPSTAFVCPETCPKGMANGPCGASKANGECEHTSKECIYSKRMRIAAQNNDYISLEETYVKPVEKRRR